MVKVKYTVDKLKEKTVKGTKFYDITLRPSKTKITKAEKDSGTPVLHVRVLSTRLPLELHLSGVKDKLTLDLKKDFIIELIRG